MQRIEEGTNAFVNLSELGVRWSMSENILSAVIGIAFGGLQFFLLTKLAKLILDSGNAQTFNQAQAVLLIAAKLMGWFVMLGAVAWIFSVQALLWAAGGTVITIFVCIGIRTFRNRRKR